MLELSSGVAPQMDPIAMSSEMEKRSLLDKLIRFCLENKLVVALLVLAVLAWGVTGS